MAESSKSLSTQAAVYFIGRSASVAVTFLVPVILVRIFSKNDYGFYALLLLTISFFFNLLQFGFGKSLFFLIPKHEENSGYYVTNTFIIFSITGIINLLILTIFQNNIADLFNAAELSSLIPLCGIHILFMLISFPFEPLLVIDSKAEKAAIIVFVSEIIRGICIIAFVLIFKTVLSVMAGLICYSFLRFLTYSIFAYRSFGIKIDKASLDYLKQQRKYAMPIGLSGIVRTVSTRIDRFILSAFFTPEIYAIYNVGNYKFPLINRLFISVGEVVMPRAVELIKMNRIKEFLGLWQKVIIRLSFAGIGGFFILQILAHDLITLIFTTRYEASVPVFRVLLLLFFGKSLQYGIVLRVTGHTKDIFKSNFLAFIFSIPLTFVLVENFGIIGASVSAVSVYFINAFSQLYYSTKRLNVKINDLLPLAGILKIMIINAGLFILIYPFQDNIPGNILRIITTGIIFSGSYIYLCYKTNIYNLLNEDILKNKILIKIKSLRFNGIS